MKTLSPALQSHLDDGTTILSGCWPISLNEAVHLSRYLCLRKLMSFSGRLAKGATSSSTASPSSLLAEVRFPKCGPIEAGSRLGRPRLH